MSKTFIFKDARVGKVFTTTIPKTWGREVRYYNSQYCLKSLEFDNPDISSTSMHYHLEKHETFYVSKGKFLVECIDVETTNLCAFELEEGEHFIVPPGLPHKITALVKPSILLEASTYDIHSDSYRIEKNS